MPESFAKDGAFEHVACASVLEHPMNKTTPSVSEGLQITRLVMVLSSMAPIFLLCGHLHTRLDLRQQGHVVARKGSFAVLTTSVS